MKLDEGTIVFIMPDKLTHKNLQFSHFASYLFMESGEGYKGIRLYLTQISEKADPTKKYCHLLGGEDNA